MNNYHDIHLPASGAYNLRIWTILATQLVPDMVGNTVSLYTADNKRITGTLTAYCRHRENYTIEVDGTRHWGIRHSAEIDVHTETWEVAA